jgi:hypothetical protein
MTKLTTQALVNQGRISAESYDSCDTALAELNGSFGVEYEAAKNNLTTMLSQADAGEIDLGVFQGENSLFKFPEFKTNIVVRIDRVPTPHQRIDKLDDKIADLELKLKLAKSERKALIEQLILKGQVDLLTDKITAVFRRLK